MKKQGHSIVLLAFFFFFYKSEITEIYKPFWKKHEIKEKSCYQERERGGSSGFGW